MTRKEEIEAEVLRIMSLPDHEQTAEILKMVDMPASDRRAFVEAYMRRNQEAEKQPSIQRRHRIHTYTR